MIENTVYKKFLQKALDMNLSAADIDGITKEQILNFAENQNLTLSDNFIANAKALVKEKLTDFSDKEDLQFLKDHFAGSFSADFRTRFPDFEVEMVRNGNKRIITLGNDRL